MTAEITDDVDAVVQQLRQPGMSVDELLTVERAAAELTKQLRDWARQAARIRQVAIAETARRSSPTETAVRMGVSRQLVSKIMNTEAGPR